MLAGAGFGDDPRLAHAPGEQDLAEHIVDLMRAGVVQLLALEIDFGTAEMRGQPLGEIERARPPDIMGQQIVEFGLESRIFLGRLILALEVENERHQRLGDEAAAENAEMPAFVRAGTEGIGVFQFQYRLALQRHRGRSEAIQVFRRIGLYRHYVLAIDGSCSNRSRPENQAFPPPAPQQRNWQFCQYP